MADESDTAEVPAQEPEEVSPTAPQQAIDPVQPESSESTPEPAASEPAPESPRVSNDMFPSTSVPAQQNIKNFQSAASAKIQSNRHAKLEKIIEFAKHKKSITNNDAQLLLGVSDATATRYLSELVKTGKLKRVGKQKRPTYEPA